MIQMIITDLDQTLLRNDGTISGYTAGVLQACRERGVLLGIATARLWLNAVPKQRALGADLLICSNGSRVMLRDDTLCWEAMDELTVERLTAALNGLSSMREILMEGKERVYINTRRFSGQHPLAAAVYTDFSGGRREEACQIFAGIESAEEAEWIQTQFPQCRCLHYRDSNRYAFMAKGVSKENAIIQASEKLDIPLPEIAAFGDDEGDIGMLRLCGVGVAVKNALPQVRKAADVVVGTNEEDGVAKYLEREILG